MENPKRVYEPFIVVTPESERAVRFGRLYDDLRDLAGKILTIVDAAISEERQNKATKDLVKSQFRSIIGRYEDICFFGKQGSSYPELN